ncbi:hypothetical protein [Sphingomonas sp. SRS2]|uniref:hypothetical protein n=1 Tax=Sphingomonas sp. SRS2 TaxID=133190 RepID=UPI0006183EA4|nr:hypothetical protein [Sphingomonas sp. SRS2]KKC24677.1 hypothetical protein WP12_17735 [Sphingomonas sp. SRS2]
MLWETHAAMRELHKDGALHPQGARLTMSRDTGPLSQRQIAAEFPRYGIVDLLTHIDVAGRNYMPIVRSNLHLNCELDILFLRQQDPGDLISQGGDIDNRIKVLLDALRVPSPEEASKIEVPEGLTHCLMESDTLVSRLNVDTDRLLCPTTARPDEVHLIVNVTIKVLRVTNYNLCLI